MGNFFPLGCFLGGAHVWPELRCFRHTAFPASFTLYPVVTFAWQILHDTRKLNKNKLCSMTCGRVPAKEASEK